MINSLFILALFIPSQSEDYNEFHMELSPAFSFYNGDAMRTNTLGSLALTARFTPAFWVTTSFSAGNSKVDRQNGMNLRSGKKFLMADGALVWNLPAVLGVTKHENASIGSFADFYTYIGGGTMWVDKKSEFYGMIGGGLEIHTGWQPILVRFDLKSTMYGLKNSKGSDFNSDLILAIGPSFLL